MAANPATATFGAPDANSVLPARHRAALADLAFASVGAEESAGDERSLLVGRHLAFLPTDAIELALADPAQRRFGDYELIGQIGEGGMGVVYRARQMSLERDVAIKLLAAGPWASREFIDRFLREARHAARMQHPNIVAVYEVGTAEELHYFSMRLVEGTNLAEAVQREGPLDARRAASLMRIVAEAVAYAHSLDVLHLDLKPANVLLDESGAPHVADFGLARKFDRALALGNTEISGTPSYMAPEQAELGAHPLSPATDLWGLGAILYEITTGHPPFRGESTQMTLELLRTQSPERPRLIRPDLPPDLEAIILKCLAREPAARYAGARELADDLGRFLAGYEVRARPLDAPQRVARWARREPKLAITAALALAALLIGLAATTTQWRRANANAQRAETERGLAEHNATISSERLWNGRRDTALRLMRDGKGFEALAPLISNIEEKETAGNATAADIERREIGMIEQQGVTLIDRMIIPDASPMATALSPDGSLLAVTLNDVSVRWYDTATLTERGRVDLIDHLDADQVPTLPRFIDNHRMLVSGEWIAFLPAPGTSAVLIDLDRGEVVPPPPGFADLADISFSADGRHALLHDTHERVQLWQVEPWRPLSALAGEFIGNGLRAPWVLDPKLRYALQFGRYMSELRLFDPHRLDVPRLLKLPPHETFSAWAVDPDGAWFAVGTTNGEVFVIDPESLAVRQLPGPVGSRVSWLDFSEDGAWLAAARSDGAALVFEAGSGELLHAGQIQTDFGITRVELSRRERLVVVSGQVTGNAGGAEIWHLPEEGPARGEATPLLASPTRAAHAGPYWLGTSLATGLLSTADMDGEVRLWRLPHATTLASHPPPLVAGNLHTDGRHVVDVDYDRLRVTNVADGRATPWLPLPPPIAFADLVDGGRTLVVVSRRSLDVLDAATLQRRRAPIVLEATPQRLVVSPDAKRAALTFNHNGPHGFEERIALYDLDAARRLDDGSVAVKAPLRQFELSPDASRLLATGPADGATEVFDTKTLKSLGAFAHDREQPVIWAAFTANAERVWLVTRDIDDTRVDMAGVLLWDLPSRTLVEQRRVPGLYPIGITTLGDKPLVAAQHSLVLDPGKPDERIAAGVPGEVTATFATSHDGRLVAHASGTDVQLYDSATLSPIGSPLKTQASQMTAITAIGFDDEDKHLIAHIDPTNFSPWRLWSTPSNTASVEALHDEADLVAFHDSGPRVLRMASADERARLRSRDPGPPPPPGPHDTRPAARWVGANPIPPREAGLSPLLIDLGGVYNIAPKTSNNVENSVVPSLGKVPFGVPHLDGVDYDWRGALELRPSAEGAVGARYQLALRDVVRGLAAPPVPIAALHVLLFATQTVGEPKERVYANVRLHYRDGSEAVLPIRTQREVVGWTEHDRPTPIGWVEGPQMTIGMIRPQMFNNPRLPNPHPERIVATIDLETPPKGSGWSAPAFFAITAEPVIGAAKPGITSEKAAPPDAASR